MEKQPSAESKATRPKYNPTKDYIKLALTIAVGGTTAYQVHTTNLKQGASYQSIAWNETKEDVKDVVSMLEPASEAEKSMMLQFNAKGKTLREVSDYLLRNKYHLDTNAKLSDVGVVWSYEVARDIARNNGLGDDDFDIVLNKDVLIYPDLIESYDPEEFATEYNVTGSPADMLTVTNEEIATK